MTIKLYPIMFKITLPIGVNNYGISGYGVHQMLAQIIKEPNILSDINILVTDLGIYLELHAKEIFRLVHQNSY